MTGKTQDPRMLNIPACENPNNVSLTMYTHMGQQWATLYTHMNNIQLTYFAVILIIMLCNIHYFKHKSACTTVYR